MRRRRDEGPAGECDVKRELVEEGKLSSYRITAVSPCLMVMLSVDLWLSTLITGNPVGIKHSSRKKTRLQLTERGASPHKHLQRTSTEKHS